MKKKIIVDEGGKPNIPEKTAPQNDKDAENFAVDDLPAPLIDPAEIDDLNEQVQTFAMNPVTVTIPAPSNFNVQVNGHQDMENGTQPRKSRKSFLFVPDGASEETVRSDV